MLLIILKLSQKCIQTKDCQFNLALQLHAVLIIILWPSCEQLSPINIYNQIVVATNSVYIFQRGFLQTEGCGTLLSVYNVPFIECDFSFLRSILTFLDEVEKAEDDAVSEISQVRPGQYISKFVKFPYLKVVQGGLWQGSRAEKIEDHGFKNFVFPNHENKLVRYCC